MCEKSPKETGRQFWVFFGFEKVRVCKYCRITLPNHGLKIKRNCEKVMIFSHSYPVLHYLEHGKIILFKGKYVYFTQRIRIKHLYLADNSYPVSVSVVSKLKNLGVNLILVKEYYKGKSKFYLFKIDDYVNGNVIKHNGHDSQYSVPLEKGKEVVR